MAVSVCPAPEDLAAGRVFGGEDGVLLGKMFAAIGLAEDEVRRTSWLQTVEFKPSAAQVEADAARMQAECGLCGAQAVVLLGRFAQEPQFAAAIGRAFAGLPVFKIPHPASILRRPQLRAEAWEELKRLRDFLQAV
nr:uracil-DNA glycosylase family protein [Kingella potus]